MLHELNIMIESKEKFLAQYVPVRRAFEEFLKSGKRINGGLVGGLKAIVLSAAFGRLELPTYERGINITPSGQESVHIHVRTEGEIYPYSDKIPTSYIIVSLTKGSEKNGPIAILPPIQAFMKNEENYQEYTGTPQRLSEVLPLLVDAHFIQSQS